jgi:hypothetical protein
MSPRLWTLVVALLMAAQFGLLLHQTQHHLHPGVTAADNCALCQVTAGATTGPAGPLLILPAFILIATITRAVMVLPRRAAVAAAFQSRAPPASHSF